MIRRFLSLLGPGLLYAGAAIGVSHLVQSTRAGADFGFELMWIIFAANLLKFPFFEIGSRYVLATGKNLVDAYFDAGKWILALFLLLTLLTMFPIQAALTLVTAGLANNITGLGLSSAQMSIVLVLLTMTLLILGRYKLLDNLIKYVIVALTITTVLAVISSLNIHPKHDGLESSFDWMNKKHIFFLIAFIGWMPAPIDIVVWTSLWSQTKFGKWEKKPALKDVLIEFRVAYFGTMLIAAAFLALGALVMYGNNEALSPNGAVFAGQLIGMYTSTIGNWAYPVIATAALSTMLSTTITVSDAYPRTLRHSVWLLFPPLRMKNERISYFFWIFILSAGVILLITYSGSTMGFMVDMATSISFVTAPVLAFLNYKVITSSRIEKKYQPGIFLRIWSWIGIIFLSLFTFYYIYWLFT
ncbi:MAG: Nramp family divalent metal transporter [Bacteroidales bacterium]|nr:Nramp family divalent metal transporter [Bacteroidales bacterium]MDP2235806.1 Nramp family divalent metal transporter [Bacteroidales bacterium]